MFIYKYYLYTFIHFIKFIKLIDIVKVTDSLVSGCWPVQECQRSKFLSFNLKFPRNSIYKLLLCFFRMEYNLAQMFNHVRNCMCWTYLCCMSLYGSINILCHRFSWFSQYIQYYLWRSILILECTYNIQFYFFSLLS